MPRSGWRGAPSRRGAAAYGVAYLLSGRQFSLQKCDFVFCGKGEKSPVASKYCGKPLRGCVGSRSAAGAAAPRLVGARIQYILKKVDSATWERARTQTPPWGAKGWTSSHRCVRPARVLASVLPGAGHSRCVRWLAQVIDEESSSWPCSEASLTSRCHSTSSWQWQWSSNDCQATTSSTRCQDCSWLFRRGWRLAGWMDGRAMARCKDTRVP